MFIKMKKYLLSLLIVPFLSIGSYINAENFTVNCTAYVGCTPEIVYTRDNLQDENSICITNLQEWINVKVITEYDEYSIYTYEEMQSNNFCVARKIKWIWFTADNVDWEKTFNIIWWWLVDSTTNNNWWSILEWWTANFTPVITGLTNSINEFIPYVVYIGLWVLSVLIWFVAIKRLINWIRAKIFSSFK